VRPRVGAIPDRPMEPTRVARTQETFRLLGWSPQTSLVEGLRCTIQWYREEAELQAQGQVGR